MSKRSKDYFYKAAKQKGVVARSFFKLEELDQRQKIFRPGSRILDIGAAPGSWVQYAQEAVGPSGFILAVDLNPLKISVQSNTTFIQGNILDLSPEYIFSSYGLFDGVISDVAPRTIGNQTVDHTRSYDLCAHVVEIAKKVLKPKGTLVFKMYQGEQTRPLIDSMKTMFQEIKIKKPPASRKESREIYVVAQKRSNAQG